MEYGLGREGLIASLQKLIAQKEAQQQRASMQQVESQQRVTASLQTLLAQNQNEVKQRAFSLGALQQMDQSQAPPVFAEIRKSNASYQWQANAHYQQQVEHPMQQQNAQERRKLEDAGRALQAALLNWHACYQEVQLGQPLVPGALAVNSKMVDQLTKLRAQTNLPISLPPGLAPPEANGPATPPSSSLGSPYLAEASNPWYVPLAGQLFDKPQSVQHEQQKMLPAKFAEKRTKVPEDACAAADAETETLRTHLQALLKFESSSILIVRKINRLGFDSATSLKEHFSLYGTVLEVYVAHSRVKPTNTRQSQARWRPSGLGFVVMSHADEVTAILKQGAEQDIQGCAIRVQKFERRAAMEAAEKAGDKQQTAPGLCEDDESHESRLVGA